MNVTTKIKNKEESLAALMSRILKEPLDPISKSIKESSDALLDAKEKLDDIDNSISAIDEAVGKSLKRSLSAALNQIKDEFLPDQAQTIQNQFKAISEAGAQKIQNAMDAQQQSIDSLTATLKTAHDTVMGAIHANQELNQRAIAELTQQCTTSNQTLAAGLQKATHLLGNAISTQQRSLETSHQTLLDQFSSAANDCSAIRQSFTHLATQYEVSGNSLETLNDSSKAVYARLADVEKTSANIMEGNQAALTHMLTEQNSALTAHIAAAQAKLKTLTITTAVFFVSMLGYVGYDVWSKFN